MQRNLVPPFILEKLSAQQTTGQIDAVSLFADVSGFTQLTTQLMAHGKIGAEILAATLQSIFEPLVQAVAEQGGFVATFAGDAFQAIFPGSDIEQLRRATEAAWWIHTYLAENSSVQTRFGQFDFAVKVSVAEGPVTWRIWPPADDETTAGSLQSRVFVFGGPGLGRCMQGESLAGRGEVVLTHSAYVQLQADQPELFPQASVSSTLTPAVELILENSDFVRINGLDDAYLPPPNIAASMPDLSPADEVLAGTFYPPELLQSDSLGEFRDVVTVFIDLNDRLDTDPMFMSTLLQLLHQYGGFLCRVDQKGASERSATFLLFWGAPRSHENDVVRAINFFLALKAQTTISVRAGLTFATAFAGYVGSPLREEYTCYSAHVTQAVRQMVKAEWGQILIDADTTRYAEGDFELAPHGNVELKGYSGTQAIYNVVGQRTDQADVAYEGELVGRQAEVDRLWSAIQPIFQGRFAGLITITGEAGMGKSRLVHEFQMQTLHANPYADANQPIRWGLCQSDEILRQPLNPFRYWLRSYFEQSLAATDEANKARFDATLGALIAELHAQNGDATLAAELDRSRSFLGALVDLRWENSLYEQLEPELRLQNMLDALKSLIKAESLRQPLVLFVEDIHWIDDDSMEFLEKLLRNVAQFPFAVITTKRPRRNKDKRLQGSELPRTEVELNRLSKDELAGLATHVIEGPASPHLVDLLDERAGGNPFFAEQILLYLHEQALLEAAPEGWTVAASSANGTPSSDESADVYLPTDLRSLLTARLDRLPPDVKETVQTASILGREFDTPVLAHMMDHDAAMMSKVDAAENAAIWSRIGESRYFFRHITMHDSVYDMQLRSQRQDLHRKAGDALTHIYAAEPAPHYAELAHHYHEAAEADQERTFAWLAGTYAAEQYANQDAIRYFSRALDLTPDHDLETQQGLLLEREAVYSTVGQREEQTKDLRHLEELANLQNEPSLQAEVALRNAAYLLATGSYQEATQYAEASARYAAEAKDPLAEARAYHRWGRSYWQAGDYEKAEEYLIGALERTRQTSSLADEAQCLYDLSVVHYYQKHFSEMRSTIGRAISQYQDLDDPRGECRCLSLYALFLQETGDIIEANETYASALAQSRKIGWRYGEARMLSLTGDNYLKLGNLASSQQLHEQAIEIFKQIDDSEGLAISLDSLGLSYQFRQEFGKARSCYEQALKIYQTLNSSRGLGYVLTHLGYTLTDLNDLQPANKLLTRAIEMLRKSQEQGLLVDALAGCARLAMLEGKTQNALAYVDEIEEWVNKQSGEGIEFPVQVYLISYQVLSSNSNHDSQCQSRAARMKQAGYKTMQEHLDKIEGAYHSDYVKNIPFNRDLYELWRTDGHPT